LDEFHFADKDLFPLGISSHWSGFAYAPDVLFSSPQNFLSEQPSLNVGSRLIPIPLLQTPAALERTDKPRGGRIEHNFAIQETTAVLAGRRKSDKETTNLRSSPYRDAVTLLQGIQELCLDRAFLRVFQVPSHPVLLERCRQIIL
jgi:hypothetical protein